MVKIHWCMELETEEVFLSFSLLFGEKTIKGAYLWRCCIGNFPSVSGLKFMFTKLAKNPAWYESGNKRLRFFRLSIYLELYRRTWRNELCSVYIPFLWQVIVMNRAFPSCSIRKARKTYTLKAAFGIFSRIKHWLFTVPSSVFVIL